MDESSFCCWPRVRRGGAPAVSRDGQAHSPIALGPVSAGLIISAFRNNGAAKKGDGSPERRYTWEYCAPIINYWGELAIVDPPVSIGPDSEIGNLLEWYAQEGQRDRLAFGAQPTPSIGAVGHFSAKTDFCLGLMGSDDEDDRIFDELAHICRYIPLALWFSKPSSMSIEELVYRCKSDHNQSAGMGWISLPPSYPLPHQRGHRLTRDDVQHAAALFRVMMSLPRDATVWSALRMVRRALSETAISLRTVLHWVALEALFGVSDRGELSFRLSSHIALYLSGDPVERRSIAARAKKLYGTRSDVVHGARSTALSSEKVAAHCDETEQLIRRALTKILLSGDHRAFDSSDREEFFRDLMFGPMTQA